MNANDDVYKAKGFLHDKINIKPEVLLILGSGLGSVANVIEERMEIPYSEIPGFPVSTAPGHAGKLIFGRLSGRNVVAMQGRFHLYEGYEPKTVTLPIRVLKDLGVTKLLVTNAAGSVNKSFKPGQLMLIEDHISFFCPSPLSGPNDDRYGTRFPSMTHTYDREYREQATRIASELDIDIVKGVYCYCQGPMYETPAEIKAIRTLGADAVGMSTVPEVISAVHAGMRVLGISCITNMAAGILDVPLSEEEVLTTAKSIEEEFSKYIIELVKIL